MTDDGLPEINWIKGPSHRLRRLDFEAGGWTTLDEVLTVLSRPAQELECLTISSLPHPRP